MGLDHPAKPVAVELSAIVPELVHPFVRHPRFEHYLFLPFPLPGLTTSSEQSMLPAPADHRNRRELGEEGRGR